MISTRKKLVYGVVLVAASGLFANELVNATRSEPLFTPVERAAQAQSEPDSIAERMPQHQAPSFDDPAAQLPESAPSPAAQPKPELGAVLASLEAALERLESAPAGADGRSDVRARLQRFLKESPLSGVVCGAGGGVAMFGGRIVRTGEHLLGDEGLVNTCTPQGVGVVLAGREVWIPMPAVRVRPAASSAGSANPGAPATSPAAPNTPAPSTAPNAAGGGAANTSPAAAPSETAGGAANRTDSDRSGGKS